MRAPMVIMAALMVAACKSPVDEAPQGVGFGNYNAYMNQQQVPPPAPQGFSPEAAAAAIDAASGVTAPQVVQPVPTVTDPGMFDPNRPRGDAPTTITADTAEMANIANAGISDEQDFEAVKARETIESDKERIARNRALYQIDQPGALPERTGSDGSTLVNYALSTTHPPGVQMYSRSKLRLVDPLVACARYTSPDLAQEAFLKAGGPERDPKGLDPDGDGFACDWDPRPFRTALQ